MSTLERGGFVVLIGRDLLAVARLERAAAGAGLGLATVTPGHDPPAALRVAAVVVDLDAAGAAGAEQAAALAARAGVPGFAFFSHVDEDVGRAARAAGLTALPRGRFWREVDALLADTAR
jgi:hypothetical protein